jgi:hypothetical protein
LGPFLLLLRPRVKDIKFRSDPLNIKKLKKKGEKINKALTTFYDKAPFSGYFGFF